MLASIQEHITRGSSFRRPAGQHASSAFFDMSLSESQSPRPASTVLETLTCAARSDWPMPASVCSMNSALERLIS